MINRRQLSHVEVQSVLVAARVPNEVPSPGISAWTGTPRWTCWESAERPGPLLAPVKCAVMDVRSYEKCLGFNLESWTDCGTGLRVSGKGSSALALPQDKNT